jgi:hypothetical protein
MFFLLQIIAGGPFQKKGFIVVSYELS